MRGCIYGFLVVIPCAMYLIHLLLWESTLLRESIVILLNVRVNVAKALKSGENEVSTGENEWSGYMQWVSIRWRASHVVVGIMRLCIYENRSHSLTLSLTFTLLVWRRRLSVSPSWTERSSVQLSWRNQRSQTPARGYTSV